MNNPQETQDGGHDGHPALLPKGASEGDNVSVPSNSEGLPLPSPDKDVSEGNEVSVPSPVQLAQLAGGLGPGKLAGGWDRARRMSSCCRRRWSFIWTRPNSYAARLG